MVMPTKYYSLGNKVFLYLKDIYEIGFAYTVSMSLRFKISSIILYKYIDAASVNLQKES